MSFTGKVVSSAIFYMHSLLDENLDVETYAGCLQAAVFVTPSGAMTVLKAKATKIGAMELARLGKFTQKRLVEPAQAILGYQSMTSKTKTDAAGGKVAVEFDVGTQADSSYPAASAPTSEMQQGYNGLTQQIHQAASAAARRMRSQAEFPLTMNTSRERKPSRLAKA